MNQANRKFTIHHSLKFVNGKKKKWLFFVFIEPIDFMPELGKLLVVIGIVVVAIGVLLTFTPFGLGRLPGDILVKRGNFTFLLPLATSIIISLILSLIFFWLRGGK